MQEKDSSLRVAIIGSRKYENRSKIKEFVFHLKKKYGTDTTIISGGCPDGADKYAKKYALELGLQYEEFPPAHHQHNLYCRFPEEQYGKPYKVSNFFKRNKQIAIFSDIIVAFIPDLEPANGSRYTLKVGVKLNKKTIIFN